MQNIHAASNVHINVVRYPAFTLLMINTPGQKRSMLPKTWFDIQNVYSTHHFMFEWYLKANDRTTFDCNISPVLCKRDTIIGNKDSAAK